MNALALNPTGTAHRLGRSSFSPRGHLRSPRRCDHRASAAVLPRPPPITRIAPRPGGWVDAGEVLAAVREETLLVSVMQICDDDLLKGAMVSVTENGVRIRRLPVFRTPSEGPVIRKN